MRRAVPRVLGARGARVSATTGARGIGEERVADVEAPQAAALALGAAPRAQAALRAPSLRVNVGWALAGNAVSAACQWSLLVLAARLATPEAVGRFALASALTTPLFLLTGLQLRTAIATDVAGLFRFPHYLGTSLAGAAAGLAASVGAAALAGQDAATTAVVLAVALGRAFEAVADVVHGWLQQHERMRPIAISLAARGVAGVGAFAAVLRAGGGLAPAIVASALCTLAALALYDARNAGALLAAAGEPRAPRLERRAVRAIVATSLPLGLVMFAVSLRTYLPRFFVKERFGAAELGVFAALSSLVAAGTLVVGALGQSATPRLARHFARGEVRAFRRLLAVLLAIGAALGVAGIAVAAVAGRPILRAVFGATYAARADVLVWIMAAGLAAYVSSFVGYALSAARQFRMQLPLFTGTALACAAGCVWLVPAHGLAGAATAWGGSLLLELVAGGAILERALRRQGVAP